MDQDGPFVKKSPLIPQLILSDTTDIAKINADKYQIVWDSPFPLALYELEDIRRCGNGPRRPQVPPFVVKKYKLGETKIRQNTHRLSLSQAMPFTPKEPIDKLPLTDRKDSTSESFGPFFHGV